MGMCRFGFILPVAIGLLFPYSAGVGAASTELVDKIRHYRQGQERDILNEFKGFLTIPNDSSDTRNIRRNAGHLASLLERRGMTTRLLEVDDAPPAVYAELLSPEAERTILLYSHYDGTPVASESWATPPYEPTLRQGLLEEGAEIVSWEELEPPVPGEWRLYARSASDEKLAIMAMIAGLDALRAAGRSPSVNLKLLFEGEEEIGSPHMSELLERYKDLLKADALLLCGGPVHSSRNLVIYFGARGNMVVDVTVYGAIRHLHSGHYGNWAPNPIALLAHLIRGMRDEKGNVLIEGFQDDVRALTETEKAALDEVSPRYDEELRHELGLAWNDANNEPLVERIMSPGINLGSIHAGPPRGTVSIPREASASLGFRLVPDQKPEKIRELVERHIRADGFHIVTDPPDLETRREHPRIVRLEWMEGASAPIRTSMDLPFSRALIEAVEEVAGPSFMKLPTIGSMAPMELFRSKLEAPVIILPTANHDNNQHGPNENLRLQNLWDGLELFGNVFARIGELW